MNNKLDKYEQAIEKSLEKGEFVGSKNLKEAKKVFADAANNYEYLRKSKRISLRVNNKDLIKVKAKAKEAQIPYQTLINLLINQYVEGKSRIRL